MRILKPLQTYLEEAHARGGIFYLEGRRHRPMEAKDLPKALDPLVLTYLAVHSIMSPNHGGHTNASVVDHTRA